jgi:cell wall-associated NlpC family hydrolase
MTSFRLASFLGALVFAFAAPATAQTNASAKAPAKPVARLPRVATAKKVVRPPLEALADRGSNPNGPFAKLNVPQRDSIIENTRELLGVRYKWAGINPAKGLDCSGIVKYVFAKLGIELPHRAAELAKLGDAVTKDTSEMRPGDLLVFGKKGKRISHVGIYVGDGMMIHASSSSHRVVEQSVDKYRPAGGLQWRGVRRVIALDTVAVEGGPEPLPPR